MHGMSETVHDLRNRRVEVAASREDERQSRRFRHARIRVGFQRALHKRPVPTEYVDAAIDRIVQRVLSLGEREVASRRDRRNGDGNSTSSTRSLTFASPPCIALFRMSRIFRDALKEVEARLRGSEAIRSLSGGALTGVSPAYSEPGVDSRF
jgi:hypothetical protein